MHSGLCLPLKYSNPCLPSALQSSLHSTVAVPEESTELAHAQEEEDSVCNDLDSDASNETDSDIISDLTFKRI